MTARNWKDARSFKPVCEQISLPGMNRAESSRVFGLAPALNCSLIMNHARFTCCLLALSAWLAVMPNVVMAQDAKLPTVWKDDFSDATKLPETWVPYGRLADGTWAQGIEGHWNGKVFARPEWWKVMDGALRGQNLPDEKHPAGLSRLEQFASSLAETGLRVSWRVKIEETSKGTLRLFGKSRGQFSAELTDNHVTALEVSAAGLRLWNGNRLLSAPAPDKKAERYRNTMFEKKANGGIMSGAWHALVLELQARDVRVLLDGKEALRFTLESEQPLRSLSLEADGDKKSIGSVWFDDITVQPLRRAP